jgi:hypothetical protein
MDHEAAARDVPEPATVRALRFVLWAQAVLAGLGALVGTAARLFGDGERWGVGSYGALRTHAVPVLVVGAATALASVWLARLLPRRLTGVYRGILALEVVLLVDFAASFFTGVFGVWMVVGLLLAVAALWYLRADHTADYLLR